MDMMVGRALIRMSVYVYLMQGDNDNNLKWPFEGTIKVSLLNQLEDGQHHTKQVQHEVLMRDELRISSPINCSIFLCDTSTGVFRDITIK